MIRMLRTLTRLIQSAASLPYTPTESAFLTRLTSPLSSRDI
jgi:hypothetical protein